jgi:hypothetical protein
MTSRTTPQIISKQIRIRQKHSLSLRRVLRQNKQDGLTTHMKEKGGRRRKKNKEEEQKRKKSLIFFL